ncbi:MAG: phosphate ABC transporter, permease protein PstA [Tenericutes bacterium GWC2_34_14]|nr:MAG: phosphate ABC transporter, permease protein PstA [Tenericutes bacterium GWA2_35_7]OHE29766.1 MAG: phosphate ABC transporter, permease protein PstA [Tenericutes bacterium GWC2_34_14]OHE34745.1 MAG: phosphate ABC transporter, permease protein PstA [Tenericutes bacterium GWE2_34_108]OHE37394.1 MAG: phosphate ABC transporter, permease protein PstA [Tenericutes bacterium GWF1_35_14]OHE39472.1 MAG: phosphate ABC transporter, permease protein PstA [Tenericutes bacterium GWF2_35_184]OHE42556.1
MSNKRKFKDLFLQLITYGSAFFSLIILSLIIGYVMSRGFKLLNMDLITNNYKAINYIAEVDEAEDLCNCPADQDYPEGVFYSEKWGVALSDEVNLLGKIEVTVYDVHEDSPLRDMVNKGISEEPLSLGVNFAIVRIAYPDRPSSLSRYGSMQMILELNEATSIRELEFTTSGGGIRGSIITTFYLIGLTLVMALPIGIGSAMYLNEYAKNNGFTRFIRSMIETLTGVPSIIYGLMGLAIFVPIIVSLTDATGANLISGAMTLTVILLPVIIRTTEESLKVVPDDYRFASLALGASKTQTTFKVVLPNAIPGILTATLLAIGRIIGESAALVFAVGTVIKDEVSLTGQSTSLAVHIWSMMSDEPANIDLSTTIALIILVIVLSLNVIIKFLTRSYMKRYGVNQ